MDEIRSLTQSAVSPAPRESAGSPVGAFADQLGQAFRTADSQYREAETHVAEMAGGDGDVVETMVALSKAEMSLRFAVNLRNRALEAYNEIMRMPV